MALPPLLEKHLSLPLIVAPMFLVSGPELVVAACQGGVVGSFPSINARPASALEDWIRLIESELAEWNQSHPDQPAAPFAINLIVHHSNSRFKEDAEVVFRHQVPLVLTSVGHPGETVSRVHDYGGLVFHDVVSIHHAHKAVEAGVDGLILVCAGAGGHAGDQSPFAFVQQVRDFWDGPIVLSGSLSDGRSIRAAQVLGADLAYMGTRFIASREAAASEDYKQMIVDSAAADIFYTKAFSGINAAFLAPSIERAGFDLKNLPEGGPVDLSAAVHGDARTWRDIWSAGQGVGSIKDVPSVADLVQRLAQEYQSCRLD